MTTIINTHDMNSVMGIGDSILYIYQGHKEWEGTKDDVFTATNERLNNFIFASDLLRKVKDEGLKSRNKNKEGMNSFPDRKMSMPFYDLCQTLFLTDKDINRCTRKFPAFTNLVFQKTLIRFFYVLRKVGKKHKRRNLCIR